MSLICLFVFEGVYNEKTLWKRTEESHKTYQWALEASIEKIYSFVSSSKFLIMKEVLKSKSVDDKVGFGISSICIIIYFKSLPLLP